MGDVFEQLKYQAKEAYRASGGNVQVACSKVGISRKKWNEWYDTDETFREWIDETVEGILDFAESKLLEKVKEGSEPSIFFMLKTRGKKRGYSERTEQQITGPNGGPILTAGVNFQWLNEELPATSAMAALQRLAELEKPKDINIVEALEAQEDDATSAP